TLPPGKKCIYENGPQNAVVAIIPFELGNLVHIGWDFFNGGIGCSRDDASWNSVLAASLNVEPNEPSVDEVAEPLPALNIENSLGFGVLLFSICIFFIQRRF
ncbi:MAG: hypothetical protein AAF242_13280, partial [Bacteroidota bacterium]